MRSNRCKILQGIFYRSYTPVDLKQGAHLPRVASKNFQGARAPKRPTILKAVSANLPMDTFAFTAYLKSGGLNERTIT